MIIFFSHFYIIQSIYTTFTIQKIKASVYTSLYFDIITHEYTHRYESYKESSL